MPRCQVIPIAILTPMVAKEMKIGKVDRHPV
jgi:hypothetical protein